MLAKGEAENPESLYFYRSGKTAGEARDQHKMGKGRTFCSFPSFSISPLIYTYKTQIDESSQSFSMHSQRWNIIWHNLQLSDKTTF